MDERLKTEWRTLTVYRGVLSRPVTAALCRLLSAEGDDRGDAYGELCALLWRTPAPHSLPAAVAAEVLSDDNPFCALLSSGGTPDNGLKAAALRDLDILDRLSRLTAAQLTDGLPAWDITPAGAPLACPWAERYDEVAAYHARTGYGSFARYTAFLWRDGRMCPVAHPDTIRLCDLKSYEYQRRVAIDNTLAFLNGFEANNLLLYGDRGTGKSSTVKALLNEYADRSLRMVEMPKEYLHELPELIAQIAPAPMKFIIFIDDLSFNANDDNFAALKAVLEGGLSGRPRNVLIYATSNRRHLLKESFSDRQGDEIHHADTIQESLSLSDRFGICLTFMIPDKQRFLDIVAQLAEDAGLHTERELLLREAERWALERGARSPRFARQFIADMQARESKGV